MCADTSIFHQYGDNLTLFPWLRSTGLWYPLILKDKANIYMKRMKVRMDDQVVSLTVVWHRDQENIQRSVCCIFDIF